MTYKVQHMGSILTFLLICLPAFGFHTHHCDQYSKIFSPSCGTKGAGWWSQGWHLKHLAANSRATVSAIVDPSPTLRSSLNPDMEQLDQLGQRYRCPVYSTVEEMLDDNAGSLDGSLVASNHATHYEVSKAALESNLHVLCEKPMCTSPSDAWKLVDLVRQHPEQYFSINKTANWRKNTIRANEIACKKELLGKLEHVSCFMGSPLLWLFDDPKNHHWTQPSGDMLGNGFAWGQLSHILGWVLRVTELTPVEVFASMRYSPRSGADLYDTALIRCRENNATIALEGAATLPGENPVSQKKIENKIFGEEGYLEYSGFDLSPDSGALVLRRHDGNDLTYEGFEFENYSDEGIGPESLQAFVDVCTGHRGISDWNGCNAEIGARVVSCIEAMYRSAMDSTGGFVKVHTM